MNSNDIDLDLDGLQAMKRAEVRERAWQRARSLAVRQVSAPAEPARERKGPRRHLLEPAWV